MNGASASTVVARIRIRPNTQRKTARGTSQRLPESLRHSPRARSAIDPPADPSTIRRRRNPPRFLTTLRRPPSTTGPARPELLAVLAVAFASIAHLACLRCGQNAAMTERARPEFARALHPADDATGGELVGDAIDERGLVECVDGLAVFACRARELGPVDRRTPERMIGYIPVRIVEV